MKVVFRAFTEADRLTIEQAMPFTFSDSTNGVVAYDFETAETLAVLVAQEWTYSSVQVHQVILNPLVIRHGWFQQIGDWLFTRAHRLALYAPVPSNNERAVKINRKLGFRVVTRLKDAYDRGVDVVLMELRPEFTSERYWKPDMAEAAHG